jgi:beta-galactosidase
MQRRDVLKMIPASVAALAEYSGTEAAGQMPARAASTQPVVAEVKLHTGTPTLFLNGEPAFGAMCWVSPPSTENWLDAECAAAAAKAGIHTYSFDAGKGYEWLEPKPGCPEGFDFSAVAARYERIIAVDPDARFHLRLNFEVQPGDWWMKAYPGECEITSEGKPFGQSFASEVWRRQVKNFLKAFIAHLNRTGTIDRVIAFQTGAGHTGEWVKGETSMSALCGDYSEPMRRHFRSWLRRHYGDDLSALRAAWNDPSISFDTAEVPSAEQQLQAKHDTFRDPARERNVIDYYRCFADLSSGLLIDFCRTAKEATGGKKLAGAFYGYLMELAWNGGFFDERPESDYSTYQRSGHLGLRQVLESPYVDFLVCPYSYGFRGIGGDAPAMQPTESARLHGKWCILEDDTRTHISPDPNYGHVNSLAESLAILRRNFARVATHGQGMWWLSQSINPAKEPAFAPLLSSFRELGEFLLQTDRTPSAEIAVLLDDLSFFYESDRSYLDVPLIFQQRLWGLPRIGAPFDTFLLQDLIEGRLRPYKLYFFLNSFQLDKARRESLKRELRKDGRVALWVYAPGYLDEGPSLEHMRDLTGFNFGLSETPWGPLMHIVDFDHPVTAGLPQDLFWGTNSKLRPIFYLDDPHARVLGQVVFSQGNCKPGMGIKTFPGWTSIYVAAPNLPAALLRGIARFSGVHLYNEAGDVLYATRELLGVHSVSGGDRTFRLPREVEVVYDLFERRVVAQDADQFRVLLRPASTALYYTGGATFPAKLK